jgi:serine/threonine protein kinase
MTNRAHHPADRAAGEFTSEERAAPGASEPRPVALEEVVSRDYAVPVAPELEARSDEDDDGDAEEVVLEPDSADGADDADVEPPTDVAVAVSSNAAVLETAVLETAVLETAVLETAVLETARLETASPGEEAPGLRDAVIAKGVEVGARRSSHPPPPLPAISAEDLEASRGAFTGASPAEVTADELESTATESASGPDWVEPGEPPLEGAGGKRPAARAPWVDEVPDPVTPYEQRNSDTIKVADLPPVEQLRGRVLANRYLAEEVAEHSAFSISYRAYHLALDRAVTVRVLLRGLACSDEACQEVRRVAAAATALDHPHVASTLDFGILSDGWPFVVTEHFQGSTLARILSGDGKFVLRRVLHIGKQVAQGLSAAHEKGILHGLLCPDNVLVADPGSSAEVAKILGFGISKARGAVPGPPRSGVFGVPFYVSPEQAACRAIDVRSDVYSLGVILYELMTGAPPFSDGDFAGVLCQHLDDDAPPPSSRLSAPGALAKALDAIIERCLRKEPEKRYQTAAELADDLVRLEAAAARTKRRPMPEVQKPTTTIHSPHPKAEAPEAPGAKVIVHDDVDDPVSPEAPEVSARRSSPSLTRSSPAAASGVTSKPSASKPPASKPSAPPSASAASSGKAPSYAPVTPVPPARAPLAKPPRVRVDQATIKISAVDRERLLQERPSSPNSSWLGSVVAAIRRLIAADGRNGDDTR